VAPQVGLNMFDNLRADLARFHEPDTGRGRRRALRGMLSQGFQAILVYRWFHWLRRHRIPAQPFRFLAERYVEITTGISIPADCEIGKGLRIHHFGGIIFHPSARLGRNCTVYHGVTVGDRGGWGGAARIGDDVTLFAGAKIIGEITIGDGCVIGANAVVRESVPPGMAVTAPESAVRARHRRAEDAGPRE